MIKNYFKTALRNLLRQRVFAVINVAGLALGIATCILIGLFIFDEWSYDRFHEKSDRIVRIVFGGSVPGGEIKEANVMPPTAQAIQAEFPAVEAATRLVSAGRPFFQVADQFFNEEEMAFVDSNFFQVFSFPLIQGNSKTALIEPNTVILTETVARKYFGSIDVIGRQIAVKDNNQPLKVTGVAADLPHNSHLRFDIFTSMSSYPNAKSHSWLESGFYTYAVLHPGSDYNTMEAKLPALFEKYAGPQFPAAFGMTYTEHRKAGNDIGLHLQRLTDIHLHSDFTNDLSTPGDIHYVYIFGAIALFMLLVASINFMNLATASASRRAKEVGVRKVLGSGRKALTIQFLLESLLLTFIALLFAIGLTYLALPLFNHLSGKALTLDLVAHWWITPLLLFVGFAVGLVAGSYPAFFLSAFRPVAVLKGKLIPDNNGLGLRSGLVVFQFLVSIGLIICTTVVYKQLHYIQHKKLGYDKEHVLVLRTWPLEKNEEIFRQQLLQDSRVLHVSNSPYVPAGATYSNNFFVHPVDAPAQWTKTLRYDVDEHYIPTLGIELSAGRNFSADYGMDSLSAVINETAAATFGWNGDALGKTLVNGENKHLRIVGVVKDFHFKSLHERISPLVMVLNKNFGNLLVKAKPGDVTSLLETMKKQYDGLSPDLPFSYSFLDDRINNTYLAERKTGIILGLFAGLTVFVACLGLFGLATFTAYQRTKEIGIRKVLGATVASIIRLLVTDFVKLVGLAMLIASPIAWWAMNRWLEDFAYRIEIQWWLFGLAGLAAVMIALLTVGGQAIRAAVANPVESLRDE